MTDKKQEPGFMDSMRNLRGEIDNYLMQSAGASYPASLYEPIKYFLEFGGKRLRPLLTLLSCKAVGADYRDAIPAASAIELLHNFTLVHDDIMDQDSLRRGHQTIHTKWSESVAILTGDGLIGLAYRALLNSPQESLQEVMRIFTEGVIRVCEGQAIDKDFEEVASVSIDQYFDMIQKKTGELIAVSTEIGGIIGRADQEYVKALRRFGEAIGRAFQIQDDLLDITSSETVLGKDLGSDLAQGKKTYTIIMLQEKATESEWSFIQHILKNRRVDAQTLDEVKSIMDKRGIFRDTQIQIENDVKRAQQCLLELSNGDWANELIEFSLMILNRRH